LSYTDFAIGGVAASGSADGTATILTVEVANTGTRAGSDVVHVYANAPASSVERADELLVTFARTPTVQPGESHTLTFTVTHAALAIWQPVRQRWETEPGLYRLIVARHAADPRSVTVTVRVEGTV